MTFKENYFPPTKDCLEITNMRITVTKRWKVEALFLGVRALMQ